jgi:hypothetical protein
MKYLSILLLLISANSCQTLKGMNEEPKCPEGYECYTEVEDNMSINALEDTIGQTYLRSVSSKNSMVVKYIYKYKDNPMIADAGYSEIIYFEIPKNLKELTLENSELSQVKLYIQKSCFCVGGGIEQILNGKLKLNKSKSALTIDLEFDVEKDVKLSSLKTVIEL